MTLRSGGSLTVAASYAADTVLAAKNKCLAQSNKSRTNGNANKRTVQFVRWPS
jgi:hypothetical protein